MHRRFTPAYAGNTPVAVEVGRGRGVHPRVCGEHAWRPRQPGSNLGSPPQMRGTRGNGGTERARVGFTPAYAGNTPHHQA